MREVLQSSAVICADFVSDSEEEYVCRNPADFRSDF